MTKRARHVASAARDHPGRPTPDDKRSEGAQANQGIDGAIVDAMPRDIIRGKGEARCLPPLPSGYESQPAWGFSERAGRFSYEFSRVYGPPQRLDQRGPICALDEDRSYWSVIWASTSEAGDVRPAGRWLTYAQARGLWGSRLTFARFSSLLEMRGRLPELLHVGDLSLESSPTPLVTSAAEVPGPQESAAGPKEEKAAGGPGARPASTPGRAAVEPEEPLRGP